MLLELFFLFIYLFLFVLKSFIHQPLLNIYSVSDCVIPWAGMKVTDRHSCPAHLPSCTTRAWTRTIFRRAKDHGRKEPGSTRVGEGDCGEDDRGLKEGLDWIKLTSRSQQDRYCSFQEFENLRGCYWWSLMGGI